MRHQLKKLCGTLTMLANLGMARTFGHYEHSAWNGEFDYAVYHWRGKAWAFPTTEIVGQGEADDNPFHPESPEGRAWEDGDRSSVSVI